MSTQPVPDDRTQAELLHNLRYGSPDEQEEALQRLAAVGEAEALDAVVDYLREEPSSAARAGLEALRVLANKYIPDDRYSLAEALIPFLEAREWELRLASVRLFNTYPNELAVESIRHLIDEARDKVYAERLNRASPSRALAERTLGEAVMALASGGRLLALPDVLDMMEDPALRVVATRALGVIGSETERQHLDDLCEDGDPRVRDAAQWALGLMDERAEQFMNPPTEMPEPPPDRLHPIYWTHRQLWASDDDVIQFLVVRIAIEHLMLDQLLSEGRVPETCLIMARRYRGSEPPDHRDSNAQIVGMWEYKWHGPELSQKFSEGAARPLPPGALLGRGNSIVVSYPEDLHFDETGLVSFDCHLGPFFGQGWLYRVARREDGWTFIRVRRTWAS